MSSRTPQRSEATDAVDLRIPEPIVTRVLYAVAALLVVLHLAVSLNRYVFKASFFGADNLYVLFDLWDEVSIPSWYAASLLLLCAAALGLVALVAWRRADPWRVHWLALTAVFVAMSMDDAADIHGQTSYKLKEVLDTGGFLAYAWVIPAGALVVVAGLIFARFTLRLPSPTRWRYVLAGALFLAGALGLEMVQARYDTLHGVENMPYRLMVAAEEGLEMAGSILFLSATLRHLARLTDGVRLRVDQR